MTQSRLDFTIDCTLPVRGKTIEARHAGSTGAQYAVHHRGPLALAYRQLLIDAGPLSDDEAATILGRRLSSMCSTRNAWGDHVVPSGAFETSPFGTKRVKWAWQEARGDKV